MENTKLFMEVTFYGTILNDIEANDIKRGHCIRSTTYFYNDKVYFVTKINGETVEFITGNN